MHKLTTAIVGAKFNSLVGEDGYYAWMVARTGFMEFGLTPRQHADHEPPNVIAVFVEGDLIWLSNEYVADVDLVVSTLRPLSSFVWASPYVVPGALPVSPNVRPTKLRPIGKKRVRRRFTNGDINDANVEAAFYEAAIPSIAIEPKMNGGAVVSQTYPQSSVAAALGVLRERTLSPREYDAVRWVLHLIAMAPRPEAGE